MYLQSYRCVSCSDYCYSINFTATLQNTNLMMLQVCYNFKQPNQDTFCYTGASFQPFHANTQLMASIVIATITTPLIARTFPMDYRQREITIIRFEFFRCSSKRIRTQAALQDRPPHRWCTGQLLPRHHRPQPNLEQVSGLFRTVMVWIVGLGNLGSMISCLS